MTCRFLRCEHRRKLTEYDRRFCSCKRLQDYIFITLREMCSENLEHTFLKCEHFCVYAVYAIGRKSGQH